MSLKKVIDQDYKNSLKRQNVLFKYFRSKIADQIRLGVQQSLSIIDSRLSILPDDNYIALVHSRQKLSLDDSIRTTWKHYSQIIETMWGDMRHFIDLNSRVSMAFIARKASPPWVEVKINLKDKRSRKHEDLWMGQIHFHLTNLAEYIIRQVNQGFASGESREDIYKRIRNIARLKLTSSKEADYRSPYMKYVASFNNSDPQNGFESGVELNSSPNVTATEGIYRLDDIVTLQNEQIKANNWYHRQYSGVDDEMWSKNKSLMALERDLMSDAVTLLHEGAYTVGSENMGIDDFQWVVSFPQNNSECDSCCERSDMMMSEIKKKFKRPIDDSYPKFLPPDSPPPLHPHCKCQLVPKIKEEWAKDTLKNKGYEWDSEDGLAFNPDAKQKKLGFKKMSFDQWIETVSKL